MVNQMLEKACQGLVEGQAPIIHSDRGCHITGDQNGYQRLHQAWADTVDECEKIAHLITRQLKDSSGMLNKSFVIGETTRIWMSANSLHCLMNT